MRLALQAWPFSYSAAGFICEDEVVMCRRPVFMSGATRAVPFCCGAPSELERSCVFPWRRSVLAQHS